MAEPSSFWKELRDRKVVRVAVVYAIVAWGAVQVADTVTDILNLPEWTAQLVLLLAALGFPVALVLAWAFQLTAGRVRRAEPLARGADRSRFFLGAGIATVLWLLAAGAWWLSMRRPPADDAGVPTVAVLPLENRSSIPDQTYFVEGLHDELITQLSKIENLRVTSRTSVMGYRDGGDIREIGRALGVAAIVEGGVERVGDRIRVIVQLIDTETDDHLFGETYDEVLNTENLFEIRGDLTLRIAEALHAALTPDEERRIRMAPTDNLGAYDLVQRGKELYDGGPEDVEKALEFFAQATRMAPDYAEAWVWLSMAYNQRAQKGGYGPEMRDSARAHARHALTLDPENAGAYRMLGDHERALALRPNWETPLISLSAQAWWGRRHTEGIRLMARARQVAPTHPLVAEHMMDHVHYLLLDEEAERWLEEARRLDPDYYWIPVFDALYASDRQDHARAERALAVVRERDPGDPQVRWLDMRIGFAQRDAARVEAAARALVTDQPDWDWFGQQVQSRVLLAWAIIQQGRAEEVREPLAEAQRRAAESSPDKSTAPQVRYAAAQATMLQAETDLALARLREAIDLGFPNVRLIEFDPIWDGIRGDPRYLEAVRFLHDDLARQRLEVAELLASVR